MGILTNSRFYCWGEKIAVNGERDVLDADAVIPTAKAGWAGIIRDSLGEGLPLLAVLRAGSPPGAGAMVDEFLVRVPEFAVFAAAIQTVWLGYESIDTQRTRPLLGLSFEREDDFLVTCGQVELPNPFPPVLAGLAALIGGWLDISIPPLSNFNWFLDPQKMEEPALPELYATMFAQKNAHRRSRLPRLPAKAWPRPEDCLLIGEVANGYELVYVVSGPALGKIYLVSEDIPGILEQSSNEHGDWLRWVFQSANDCILGKDCDLPDYY